MAATAQEMFVLAATDPIRAYVSVPEVYAAAVHTGLGAYLELTQFPGQKFSGQSGANRGRYRLYPAEPSTLKWTSPTRRGNCFPEATPKSICRSA